MRIVPILLTLAVVYYWLAFFYFAVLAVIFAVFLVLSLLNLWLGSENTESFDRWKSEFTASLSDE